MERPIRKRGKPKSITAKLNDLRNALEEKYKDLPNKNELIETETTLRRAELEDIKKINAKCRAYRDALVKQYSDLTSIRNRVIESEYAEKEEFLTGKSKNADMSTVEDRKLEDKLLPVVIEHANEELFAEVDTKDEETLLKEFREELERKYANDNEVLKFRDKIIAKEVEEKKSYFAREVLIVRMLARETEDLRKELEPRYKDRKIALENEIKTRIDKRRLRLFRYFLPHGVDPDAQDKKFLNLAKSIVKDVQKRMKDEGAKWINKPEDEKIDYYRLKYEDFYNTFPIVCKYIILKNQFDEEAFMRFQEKTRLSAEKAQQTGALPKKGERDDQWIQNQAWYVRYLYEEFRKKRGIPINTKEAQGVWAYTYEKLKEEFKTFKDKFEETRDKLKEDDKVSTQALIIEMLNRIQDGKQNLSLDAEQTLLEAIRELINDTSTTQKIANEADKKSDLVNPILNIAEAP